MSNNTADDLDPLGGAGPAGEAAGADALVGRLDELCSFNGPGEGEVRGLLLRGGGGTPFAPDNPWTVPTAAGLEEALEHVWSPVAARCPRFRAALTREVLALALVHEGEHRRLGYLFPVEEGTDTGPATPLAPEDLLALAETEELAWVWGEAPVAPESTVPSGASPTPAPVRELAGIHGSLVAAEARIDAAPGGTTLADLLREQFSDDEDDPWEDEEGAPEEGGLIDEYRKGAYDRHLLLGSYTPGADSVLLVPGGPDAAGEAVVAEFSHENMRLRAERPFWEWFDRYAPGYLFERWE